MVCNNHMHQRTKNQSWH